MGKSRTVTVTVTKTGSELTIGLDRYEGTPGNVKIIGSLFQGDTINVLRGKLITLMVKGVDVKTATTDTSGRYHFDYTVTDGRFSFQTKFLGDVSYGQDYSPVVIGEYGKRLTGFYELNINPSAGASPLAITLITQLRRDDTSLGINGKTVEIHRSLDGGAFTKVATKVSASTSGGPGFIIYNDVLTGVGTYGYYLYFAGDTEYEGCEITDGTTVLDGELPDGDDNGDGLPPDGEPSGIGVALLIGLLLVTQE